jgi:ribosomal protein S18 acetylase RimI-like enzyme
LRNGFDPGKGDAFLNLHIRQAAAADRPALVKFMIELQEVERGLHPNRSEGPGMGSGHLAYLERLAAAQQGVIFVAADANELLGFVVCFVEAEDADDLHVVEAERRFGYISDLYVAAQARRQGVGRALLQAAEDYFKQLGLPVVRLAVLRNNDQARRVYEQAGFRPYEITYEKRLE